MSFSLRSETFSADTLGIWASTLCVVHCVATPVLISASAVFAHLIPGEEKTHRALAIGIATLGGIALVRGFRTHGRRRILGLMALGLACIFAGAFYGDRMSSHGYEVAVTMAGSALMIGAHRMNHTFCNDCRTCDSTMDKVC
jgi:MerC mercury resistance protein